MEASALEVPPVTGGGSGANYLVGAALGGTTMSVLSAVGTAVLEKKKPTPKTLARDFILGAVLLVMILQLLPESTGRLIGYVTSLFAVPAALGALPSIVAPAASDDIEVKVGVPRF